MPLDEIKKNIEASARSEAESIRSSPLAETKKILDDASENAKRIEQEYESETAKEIERMRQEQADESEHEARVKILEATDAVVRREAKEMRGELSERLRKSDRYGVLFKEAVKKAQEVAPTNELVVKVNKNDEHFIKGLGAQIEIEYENILGLVIRSKDSTVKIDATLDRLVDSSMEDVMKAIMSEIRGRARGETTAVEAAHKSAAKKSKQRNAAKSARASKSGTAKRRRKAR